METVHRVNHLRDFHTPASHPGKFEQEDAWVEPAYQLSLDDQWDSHGTCAEDGYNVQWTKVDPKLIECLQKDNPEVEECRLTEHLGEYMVLIEDEVGFVTGTFTTEAPY